MSDLYGPVVIGNGEGEPVKLPPVVDHLDRFVPLGFTWEGRCFEFREDEGQTYTVEVEGWSGYLGNGWSYDIWTGESEDPVCDHPTDAIMWNPWNLWIQCHRCGAIIEELTA